MSTTAEAVKPYRIEEVGEVGDGKSRFKTTTSPSGFPTQPVSNVAFVYAQLVNTRREAMEPVQPPEVTVELKWPVRDSATGEWRCTHRGTVTRQVSVQSERATRFRTKSKAGTAGQFLDALALGHDDPWKTAPDSEIWSNLLALIEQEPGITSAQLRELVDAVSLLVLTRAGIANVDKTQLPYPEALKAPRNEP